MRNQQGPHRSEGGKSFLRSFLSPIQTWTFRIAAGDSQGWMGKLPEHSQEGWRRIEHAGGRTWRLQLVLSFPHRPCIAKFSWTLSSDQVDIIVCPSMCMAPIFEIIVYFFCVSCVLDMSSTCLLAPCGLSGPDHIHLLCHKQPLWKMFMRKSPDFSSCLKAALCFLFPVFKRIATRRRKQLYFPFTRPLSVVVHHQASRHPYKWPSAAAVLLFISFCSTS